MFNRCQLTHISLSVNRADVPGTIGVAIKERIAYNSRSNFSFASLSGYNATIVHSIISVFKSSFFFQIRTIDVNEWMTWTPRTTTTSCANRYSVGWCGKGNEMGRIYFRRSIRQALASLWPLVEPRVIRMYAPPLGIHGIPPCRRRSSSSVILCVRVVHERRT